MTRFLLIFALFFTILEARAEIDPMINLDMPPELTFQFPKDINPKEVIIKQGNSSEVPIEKKNVVNQTKDKITDAKDNFFEKYLKKKPKQKAKFDALNKGYTGILPNIQAEFEYKHPKKTTIKDKKLNAKDYLPEEFQNSKIDDPLFLDVILGREKASAYVVDMLRIMKFLESFRKTIENKQDIQRFNANVNLLDLHARRIETLYSNKPEGESPSYWLLLDLAYKAKILGNLKYDANYYSKFSPITGTKYDPVNIENEDKKLMDELDETVFAIRQLNN